MQPISGTPARPPGEGQTAPSVAGEQPLSTQQRTVLERLITRLISLTQQQSAEVWAGMKHDLGVKSDTPLLSRHFPAAEQNLTQRLSVAQQNHANRQVLSQLTELLSQGNNRQAVSDFIRQQYGQTALSQLTPEQLKNVLTLLQQGQLSIPQPQQRPPTDRPLLPAEHNTLNQLVTKLAAATGESGKLIWQSMLELSGVKSGELIPAKQFTHLVTWLQARQTLSNQSAPTLQTLQAALKLPLEPNEFTALRDYAQQTYQALPHTILTTAQVQDLLNQVFLRRVARERELTEPHHIQPIFSPFAPMIETIKSVTARPGLIFIALAVAFILFWLVS
ncbi:MULTISPECIES: flagella biosynthesis regulator Flk [Citrobacter]|uniref:flagella biosynthesis regulator Flk n=1 Tax=Citrobacter TaxID=544 RepID=UPI0008DCB2E8|nr:MULTISPECIES: flagella biosynthesis regulator Flk [Citrobacter]MBE0023237.1 flagella biosynthesis regulator Flk [Citrobacter koseri]MBE0083941.1 flagella biosynthesis regulator Flk [Citrobacter koseri]MBJ8809259.1 flagella biosynthesis regulator Flk [Citrobacter koseri]MBJ9344159.1 flagella biosynthesis regulator Flk [Citrobacter koseri]MBJ9353863.1 flagella biosynthesis regulator Flk [Citrobacter koseri]